MKKLACLLLTALLFQLCSCAAKEPVATEMLGEPIAAPVMSVDLMANRTAQTVSTANADERFAVSAARFAVSLLRSSYTEGETCVLSPYSVMRALAMTANGADGQTLSQLQAVLGLSVEELNAYLAAQSAGSEVTSADSLWMKNGFAVNDAFLQTNADYYRADAYSVPFDDVTLHEINAWITEHTGGRVGNALDAMHPNAALYLINALTFDARWTNVYTENNLLEGAFHGANGDETVQMLSSEESVYLEDSLACGFMKEYAGGQYSFVALLPNEGVSISEYLSCLTGEGLHQMIQNAENTGVLTQMPKCTLQTRLELKDALSAMGAEDAFTNQADFSRMTDEEIFISRVLHQTYLCVDERGTQAGAVTMEEFVDKGMPTYQKTVILDRPYVMGIYDRSNQCFLFLGVVNSINN